MMLIECKVYSEGPGQVPRAKWALQRMLLRTVWWMVGVHLACIAAHGQIRYHVTSVPTLLGIVGSPTAINDSGQMTGVYYPNGEAVGRAFFYDGTKVIDLPTSAGETLFPYALNAAGQIVGVTKTNGSLGRGFLYSGGRVADLGAPANGEYSRAVAINGAGQIAGWFHRLPGERGALWSNGQMIELDSLGGHFTRPTAINNLGQVAGYSSVVDFTPPHAFLYSEGGMIDLGTNGGRGSYAYGINDAGQVVGSIFIAHETSHAMLYSQGKMRDLGTLGGAQATAFAINNFGVIVGESYSTPMGGIRAFVCLDGLMLDLNALADLPPNVEILNNAFAINNRGQILCNGGTTSGGGSFLLTPISGSSALVNFSLRAAVGTGERTPIIGLALRDAIGSGTSDASRHELVAITRAKSALLRASGPALTSFNVSAPAADPRVTLFNGSEVVKANEDWGTGRESPQTAAAIAQTGAFPLADASKDAALVTALGPGNYTAQIGADPPTGIVLAEIYDADNPFDPDFRPRICNASGRAHVGVGDNILIAGFVIGGDVPKTVLIRALGPSLSSFGIVEVLPDPKAVLFSGSNIVASNDNWNSANNAALIAAASERVGAFSLPGASKDAAIFMTLRPGAYSLQVSGVGDATGVALVEIYDVL